MSNVAKLIEAEKAARKQGLPQLAATFHKLLKETLFPLNPFVNIDIDHGPAYQVTPHADWHPLFIPA